MQSPKLKCEKLYISAGFYIYLALLLQLIRQINGLQMTADNKDYYTAGVVEFRPTIFGMSSADMLADHLNAYVQIIESEDAKATDILVFPEGTLNNAFHMTYVPSESEHITPCLQNETNIYEEFLVTLSCSARKVRKYLVVNLIEKENCCVNPQDTRPCSTSGLNVYNTNVAFDRAGKVVSRYRKVHVYVEEKNTTLQPEYGIFYTDFGVTFGHFICFDILFYTPAQELVDRYNVTDVIFTSYFYSEMPFLMATQLQQGWAWGNNINLLAAGASYPQTGTTGSGIYAGNQGALISVMAKQEGQRKLYTAKVQKKKQTATSKEMENRNKETDLNKRILSEKKKETNLKSNIKLLKDPQIKNYKSILLNTLATFAFKGQLCYQELCCSFDIAGERNSTFLNEITSHYHYRIGVFDGRRTYQKEEWSDIQVCALYSCANESVESCGEQLEQQTSESFVVFHKIHIKGNFSKISKVLIMPSTLDGELNQLENHELEWQKRDMGSFYEVNFELTKERHNLLTFGIYVMYFDKSEANCSYISWILGIGIFLSLFTYKTYLI